MDKKLVKWKNEGDHFIHDYFNIPINVYFQIQRNSLVEKNKTIVLLHGYPESSFSFHKVIPILKKQFQTILVMDFVGFGFSDKLTAFSYSLSDQAQVIIDCLCSNNIQNAHFISHDMGDSVLTELLHIQNSHPNDSFLSQFILSATFTNGGMVLRHAQLRWTQRLMIKIKHPIINHLLVYPLFKNQIISAHGNGLLSPEDINLLWQSLLYNDGQKVFYKLINYLNERKRHEQNRWLPALKKSEIPINICWGTDDRVAPLAIAKYLISEIRPDAKLIEMKNCGHFCQLQSPELWVQSISKNLV